VLKNSGHTLESFLKLSIAVICRVGGLLSTPDTSENILSLLKNNSILQFSTLSIFLDNSKNRSEKVCRQQKT